MLSLFPYYNEACANCGIPVDIHLSQDDPIILTPNSIWGDLNKCRKFVRCCPPRPAYGIAWWEMSERDAMNWHRKQLGYPLI